MKRDIEKSIKTTRGTLSDRRDLSIEEANFLFEEYKQNLRQHGYINAFYETMVSAFYFGVSVGRAEPTKRRADGRSRRRTGKNNVGGMEEARRAGKEIH